MRAASTTAKLLKRVHRFHARLFEIASVSHGDGEVVFESSRRDHAVQQRDAYSFTPQVRHQSGPTPADRSVSGNAFDRFNNGLKPIFKFVSFASSGQREDPSTQFAKSDRIDDKIGLVRGKPFDDPGLRRLFCRFAQYVRIDEECHPSLGASTSFVLSLRSSGWNQSLTGQESSSLTKPLLCGRSFRLRRYSPRSRRSIWNSCPGLMSSSLRISAGRMICPLVETVVLMPGKILSYHLSINRQELHVPHVGPMLPGQTGGCYVRGSVVVVE